MTDKPSPHTRPESALRRRGRGGQEILLVRLWPQQEPALLWWFAQGHGLRTDRLHRRKDRHGVSVRLQAHCQRALLRRDAHEAV